MEGEERNDRVTSVEDRFSDYSVYDPDNERIGRVDDLFVDENDNPEYLGVKMGFLGTSSTLIPWEVVSNVDDEQERIEVSVEKARAKDGPALDDEQEVTPEFENEVSSYYGLQREETTAQRGVYADYRAEGTEVERTEPDDEVRVQRIEEELRAGTREREVGAVRVRKRVRTERESIEVPKRREEVHIDRVPIEEGREAPDAEIGEEEISVPITEEEIVVEKRPVAKEEIRIRKDVVEDEEVVEEDVRREEVDVEDETEGHRGL